MKRCSCAVAGASGYGVSHRPNGHHNAERAITDQTLDDLHTEAVLRAHLRQIVIYEILRSLAPADADQAISTAVQRLSQYVDEGPVPSIARVANQDQLRAMVEQVIEELRSRRPRTPVTGRA